MQWHTDDGPTNLLEAAIRGNVTHVAHELRGEPASGVLRFAVLAHNRHYAGLLQRVLRAVMDQEDGER